MSIERFTAAKSEEASSVTQRELDIVNNMLIEIVIARAANNWLRGSAEGDLCALMRRRDDLRSKIQAKLMPPLKESDEASLTLDFGLWSRK